MSKIWTCTTFVLVLLCSVVSLAACETPGVIVTFGDSTTASRGPLKVYADLLRTELGAEDPSWRVINAGVGGNTTRDARMRFETAVLEQDPEFVIIQFGINDAAVDVWRDPPATQPRVDIESYASNLRYFVDTLQARGCRVILMTPNPLRWTAKLKQLYGRPPYEPDDEDGFNVLLAGYATRVREIAQDKEVPVVDVFELFAASQADAGLAPAELLLDGMHPNDRGHRLIADQLIGLLTSDKTPTSLIQSISKETLWRNRDGQSQTWFHPRVCVFPAATGEPQMLMTLQEIGGSDYFGQVHWSISNDLGKTWGRPEPIPALGRDPIPGRSDELKAAVCDVTPQFHPATNSVLALGHVVFYKGDYFARDEQLPRYPVYVTRSADGTWSERKILAWDDPRGAFIYSNNCGQRVVSPDGTVQMSFTFGPQSEHRMVAGVTAAFDGENLTVRQVGPPLTLKVGRGLLEPSVTRFQGKSWITIRAEDNRGYVSVSDDGLNWEPKKAWAWDDGTPLDMSTTQQHWLTHSEGLFLVYTRKDESNANVIRWRSPLWVAQVDPVRRCLIKSSERVVLPLVGDGITDPDNVALMGNFDVTNVSPDESWVTVGEWMPRSGYRGNVLLARIRWASPNRLPLW